MALEYVFFPYYKDEARNNTLFRTPLCYTSHTPGKFKLNHKYATTLKLARARCYQIVKDNPQYEYILVKKYSDGYLRPASIGMTVGTARLIPYGRRGLVVWMDINSTQAYKITMKGDLDELPAGVDVKNIEIPKNNKRIKRFKTYRW